MDERDRAFLQRRRKLAKSWNLVGMLLLLVLIGVGATIFMRVPLLANPMYVAGHVKAGTLETSTMELSAVLLPIVFLLCLGVVAVVVLFAYAMFSNERRYLAIIERLEQSPEERRTAD